MARLEAQLALALPIGNPLELGASHRDRARIALAAGDREAFDTHLAAMEAAFRTTKHPCLIAQVEALTAAAVLAGVRTEVRAVRSGPTRSVADDLSENDTFVEPLPPPARGQEAPEHAAAASCDEPPARRGASSRGPARTNPPQRRPCAVFCLPRGDKPIHADYLR